MSSPRCAGTRGTSDEEGTGHTSLPSSAPHHNTECCSPNTLEMECLVLKRSSANVCELEASPSGWLGEQAWSPLAPMQAMQRELPGAPSDAPALCSAHSGETACSSAFGSASCPAFRRAHRFFETLHVQGPPESFQIVESLLCVY